jgi:flagellar M-ring protein FliF
MSVSVMVDGITDPAQLTGLKNAVTAAAGIDAARGDTVAVESMAFDRTYATDQQTAQTQVDQTNMYYKLAEFGAGAVLVLTMIGVVLWMFSKLRRSASEQWRPVMRPVSDLAMAAGMAGGGMQMMEAPMHESTPGLSMGNEASANAAQIQSRIMEMASKSNLSAEDEQLQKMMAQVTEENPATVAEIIQMWLNEG